jgi:drug/metabolite transporter (DMT)-like permease
VSTPSLATGPAAAIAAAALFGVTTPVAKWLLEGASPLSVAGLLYLGSGIGLASWRLIQDRAWHPTGLSRSDWLWLMVATVAGGVVAPVLLLTGLSRTDAATASLLLNLEAVCSALLAWLLFREATSRRIVWGFVAILLGGIVLAWPAGESVGSSGLSGLLLISAACLSWGLDNNVTRKISGADPRVIASIKGLTAGVTNTILAVLMGAKWPASAYMATTLMLGFLGYGVSLVLFIVALRHLGTARTSAYFAAAPFIGTLLALLLFGQPLSLAFWPAIALMAIGVWLHVTEHHEHDHLHGPLTHSHAHEHDEHHQHDHSQEWDGEEPHTHEHQHGYLRHRHAHFPDLHHQHRHS